MNPRTDVDAVLAKARSEALDAAMLEAYTQTNAHFDAIEKADPLRKAQLVNAMAARKEHKAELARLNKALDEAVARRAPASEIALLEARRNRLGAV